MFIVGLLGWWYGAGWKQRVVMWRERLAATADFFSVDLLAKTLFSPYRQISAGSVQGSLDVQLRAFFDKMLSRLIGAMIRIVLIIAGAAALVFYLVFGGVLVLLWAVIPLLPMVGMVLWLTGWLPWKA